jgi:hypothetical protein
MSDSQLKQEREADRNYYAKNKDRFHRYYIKRRDSGKLLPRNPVTNALGCKKYQENHRSECNHRSKLWKQSHREHVRELERNRYHRTKKLKGRGLGLSPEQMRFRKYSQRKARRATINATERRHAQNSPQFCIARRIRATLRCALKRHGAQKCYDTRTSLGCSLEDLARHLESLFLPGMSWDNRSLWHVDHKRPLASFDLTDPVQQKIACHYTNLQPLWATDNRRKGARL